MVLRMVWKKLSQPPSQAQERRVLWMMGIFFGFLHGNIALRPGQGGLGEDPAQYLLLAQSLASGQGYRDLFLPGHPPHMFFPFVFPMLLAPLVALFGMDFRWMHLPNAVCGALIPVLVYLLVRRREGWPIALPAALFTGISPLLVEMMPRITSDLPYLPVSLMALLVLEQGSSRGKGLWLAICLVLVAEFTRTIGFTLGFGAVMALWCSRRQETKSAVYKQILLMGGVVFGAMLLWWWRNAGLEMARGGYYLAYLQWDPDKDTFAGLTLPKLWRHLEYAVHFYGVASARAIIPRIPYAVFNQNLWLWVLLGGLTVFGWFSRVTRKQSAWEWYALSYVSVILIWPFYPTRFLLPLLPALFYYFLVGMKEAAYGFARLLKQPIGGPLYAALAVSLAVSNVLFSGTSIDFYLRGPTMEPREIALFTVHDWIRKNLPSDAVVFSATPALTSLITHRHAVCILRTKDTRLLQELMKRFDLQYVLLSNDLEHLGEEAMGSLIGAERSHWRAVVRCGEVMLVQRF